MGAGRASGTAEIHRVALNAAPRRAGIHDSADTEQARHDVGRFVGENAARGALVEAVLHGALIGRARVQDRCPHALMEASEFTDAGVGTEVVL